jgi:formylglycine-generating enzyme required for sulfatase activity
MVASFFGTATKPFSQSMSTPTSHSPREASKTSPFLNSLGMPFVPVPHFETLFCIWPTRFQDYAAFAQEKGLEVPAQTPASSSDHPVVNIVWKEACDFCDWLSERESAAGKLPGGLVYRLPTDLEWSAAAGLPAEEGSRPDQRSSQLDGYPWGTQWPPPKDAGNYSQELGIDSYEFTSPVGSFSPNEFGIFDLGGNVWEWCLDYYDRSNECRVLRGASWFNGYADRLKSSFRNDLGYPNSRFTSFGFRVVLGAPAKH